MAAQLETLLRIVLTLLPACLLVAVVIGVTAWSVRMTKQSMRRADEWVHIAKEIRELLQETVSLQKEANRLLAQRQDAGRE